MPWWIDRSELPSWAASREVDTLVSWLTTLIRRDAIDELDPGARMLALVETAATDPSSLDAIVREHARPVEGPWPGLPPTLWALLSPDQGQPDDPRGVAGWSARDGASVGPEDGHRPGRAGRAAPVRHAVHVGPVRSPADLLPIGSEFRSEDLGPDDLEAWTEPEGVMASDGQEPLLLGWGSVRLVRGGSPRTAWMPVKDRTLHESVADRSPGHVLAEVLRAVVQLRPAWPTAAPLYGKLWIASIFPIVARTRRSSAWPAAAAPDPFTTSPAFLLLAPRLRRWVLASDRLYYLLVTDPDPRHDDMVVSVLHELPLGDLPEVSTPLDAGDGRAAGLALLAWLYGGFWEREPNGWGVATLKKLAAGSDLSEVAHALRHLFGQQMRYDREHAVERLINQVALALDSA